MRTFIFHSVKSLFHISWLNQEKKDKDHKVEAKRLPPTKKQKTKLIYHSACKTFNNHSKSTGTTIFLHGVEL
jgi:hypothetical protein